MNTSDSTKRSTAWSVNSSKTNKNKKYENKNKQNDRAGAGSTFQLRHRQRLRRSPWLLTRGGCLGHELYRLHGGRRGCPWRIAHWGLQGDLDGRLRRGLDATWLDGIPDASSIVDNDVIHLVEVGVDPEVLVNNTTYPIPLQALNDKDITIQLDKFQTKVTPITDDELYAISYDKMSRVKESHGNAINDAKFAKAAHALCAKQNTEKTPVLKTTGEKDPVTGRLKMTKTDLLSAKRQMDALKVPSQGRRLVLCSDHINDLLEIEQTFREQYNINRNDGTVGRLYGFDIYEFANNPIYTQTGTKKDLGAAAVAGEFQASFAFYTARVFKATGSTKMY